MNFYIKAFLIFSRIGLFTIGGGYAMVPLIEAEVVDKRKWISKEDFSSNCTRHFCCKYSYLYWL